MILFRVWRNPHAVVTLTRVHAHQRVAVGVHVGTLLAQAE